MDKIILITGGGRGIGASCALLAAQQGYKVCVNYRNDGDAALKVVTAIEDRGGTALAIQADVSDEAAVERMFALVDERFGRLTTLINNAGILSRQKCASSKWMPRGSIASWQRMSTAVFCARARRCAACRRSTAARAAASSTFPHALRCWVPLESMSTTLPPKPQWMRLVRVNYLGRSASIILAGEARRR